MEQDVAVQVKGHGCFQTTRWSVVLSSAAGLKDDSSVNTALGELCRTYWRPIFVFICRRGYPINEAQDLTQDFFVMVLEGDLLGRADPNRGRFRSLLLKALQNFLIDAHCKRSAKKRGGGMQFVSWDDWMAEAPSQLSLPARARDSWPAERLFDIRWAATVVERALNRLREECEERGRRRIFDEVSGLLSAERGDVSYGRIATTLGVSSGVVKRLAFELRQRYRQLLREEVSQTVEKPEEIDNELRYLCAALAWQED